jgi:hypothetical protein
VKYIKTAAFWDIVTCSLAEVVRRFRDVYCLHHHRNDDVQDYAYCPHHHYYHHQHHPNDDNEGYGDGDSKHI